MKCLLLKLVGIVFLLVSFHSTAGLIKETVTFSANNFEVAGDMNSPPADLVEGNFSFLLEDPVDHSDFFISHTSAFDINLIIDGFDYKDVLLEIQYRLFANSFNSFFVGAVTEDPYDYFNGVVGNSNDFYFTTLNYYNNFVYSVESANSIFSSENISYNVSFSPVLPAKVPAPTSIILLALGLLCFSLFRYKSGNNSSISVA